MKKKKDSYEVHAGDFKTEDELEEELEEDGISVEDAETSHFDDGE